MWSILTDIIKPKEKEKEKEKEWLESLFENIEMVKEQELIVPFKIIEIKKSCFLVKVKGLYAFVPLSLMPWSYNNLEYWQVIFFSLKEQFFLGKIIEINRKIETSEISRIIVDASGMQLEEAELNCNDEYTGIILQKRPYGAIIDIGYHFDWKCGSLRGLLHNSKFADFESFSLCEPGQKIVVHCLEKNEHGLLFESKGTIDWFSPATHAYTGKTVKVKIYKNENERFDFFVEDRYKAIMPITEGVYEEKRRMKMVRDAMKQWQEGDVIDCQVLEVEPYTERFIIKLLLQNEFIDTIDWNSQEIKAYVGKTAPVKVIKNGYGYFDFLVDDKYRAVMPITKSIYGNNKSMELLIGAMKHWQDRDAIDCKVLKVNPYTEQFIVKWLSQDEGIDGIDWHAPETKALIGQMVSVKITKNEHAHFDFLAADRYRAILPVTKSIYGVGKKMKAIKSLMKLWKDGDVIDCLVLEIDSLNEWFIIKWILQNPDGPTPHEYPLDHYIDEAMYEKIKGIF